MISSRSCMILIILLLCITTTFATKLGLNEVKHLAKNIGDEILASTNSINIHDDLKERYTKSIKEVRTIDPEVLVRVSAQNMENYFKTKIDSLKKIKEKAEKLYKEHKDQKITEQDVKYVNMINIDGSSIPVTLSYDDRFKKAVNTSHSGIQIPANVYEKGPEVLKTIYWTTGLDEVFRENIKRDPMLKWQYFGSHDAVFRTYPAKKWTNLHYSARRRPWYTQGAASPKNMVILVDRSGSMVGQTWFIARLAVTNLIDTLSENDFFTVLYFNVDVTSLSCNNTLIQATKGNREWFKKNLITSEPTNSVDWKLALTKAFEVLEKSLGSDCQKMIMIFTDGTEEKQESVFEKYNKNKKVRIFTYLVGTPSHPPDDLIWMACENKGHYYPIRTVGAVRDRIEDYVSVLSRPMAASKLQHPVWTGVYRDASGLGMMVTGTLPVFSNGTFLGVCGTDITIDELKNVLFQPYLGVNGYCVLINNNGNIVKHPNLRSMLGYVASLGDIDIADAEFVPIHTEDELLNLRRQILSVATGIVANSTLDSFLFTDYDHYLRSYPTQKNYYYTRLGKTPFRLAIASPQYGYHVTQSEHFHVDMDSRPETVFLNDWTYCSNTTFPQFMKDNDLRNFLERSDCNGSAIPDNLLLDLNITHGLGKHWDATNTRHNITFAFTETNWGLLRISNSSRIKEINTKPLIQRIHTFHADFIIVTTPHISGRVWNENFNASILVSRGIKLNVGKIEVIPAVVGYQLEEKNFLKDHIKNVSPIGNFHAYLLDENAFIVTSNRNDTKSLAGYFFGSVDLEMMSELEKQIYSRYSFRNHQGECVQSSSKSTSSSSRHTLNSMFAKLLKSWATAILGSILQFDIYSLISSADGATVKAQPSNTSCITNMTTYYANITTWKSFNGSISCNHCANEDETRHFFVEPIQGTNLILVVVENVENARYMRQVDGIPGRHVEIKDDIGSCKSNVMSFRLPPARCVVSKSEEKRYTCGKGRILKQNSYLILMFLVFMLY